MSINVLIADDDSELNLAPLARIIKSRSKGNVITAVTFVDALDILSRTQGSENSEIHAVLLDTILPYDRNGLGMSRSYLGMTLAEHAANLGMKTIAFLTVVMRDEVEDKFSELGKSYPDVHLGYFNKAELLSGNELHNLVEFLVGGLDKKV